jgi:hypothetical protein
MNSNMPKSARGLELLARPNGQSGPVAQAGRRATRLSRVWSPRLGPAQWLGCQRQKQQRGVAQVAGLAPGK